MTKPVLYRPFVSYETGKPVLYIRLQKALYGCLKSRPVRGQQDDRRETANSMMVRVRPKNIMRRRKRDNKNDTVDRIRIWRDSRVTWEETLLPGNVAKLISTGGSVHIHGIIPEESTLQLPRGDNRVTRNTRRIKSLKRQGRQGAIATR